MWYTYAVTDNDTGKEKTMLSTEELIALAVIGGPGLDGYAFKAAVYCPDCGDDIVRDVAPKLKIENTDDPQFSDSDVLPQPIFFGESDSEQHCSTCSDYLYGGDIVDDADEDDEDVRRASDGRSMGGTLL
jgi:hypothetical protein